MPGCVMLKAPTPSSLAQSTSDLNVPSSLAQSTSDLNVADGPPRRIFREHLVDLAFELPQEHILLVGISKTFIPDIGASVLNLRDHHLEDLGPHLLEIDLLVTHLRDPHEGVYVAHATHNTCIWARPA